MTEDLAALLAEHTADWQDNFGFCCSCLTVTHIPDREVDVVVAAHQAEVIAAAGWVNRRAVIEELITKAETGPTDGTNDPHAAYWLRAELDGEG